MEVGTSKGKPKKMKAPASMAPFTYMGGISDRACVPLLQNVVDGVWDYTVLGEQSKEWKSRQAVMNAVISWLEAQGRLQGDVWAEEDERDNSGAPRRVAWDKVRTRFSMLDDQWLENWIIYYNQICIHSGRKRTHELPSDFYRELDEYSKPISPRDQVCRD